MKRIKIATTTFLSLMVVSSSLISCNTDDLNDSNHKTNAVNLSKGTDKVWFEFVNNNYSFIENSFLNGVNQENLDTMLMELGYEKGSLTIEQFNKIYEEIIAVQNGPEMNFEDVYNKYYSDRSEYFKETVALILNGKTIDSEVGTDQWNKLTFEDQNLLKGLNELIKKYPNNDNLQAKGGPGAGTFFYGTVDLGAEASVIGFYTFLGAGIGGVLGGPGGAAIGAVAGLLVGVGAAILK